MAVKEGEARIIRDKINLGLLVASQHDDILDDAAGRLAGDVRELEAVPV